MMDFFDDARAELARANSIHGPLHSAHEGESVLREEFEEVVHEARRNPLDPAKLRRECVQVAAMAAKLARLVEPLPALEAEPRRVIGMRDVMGTECTPGGGAWGLLVELGEDPSDPAAWDGRWPGCAPHSPIYEPTPEPVAEVAGYAVRTDPSVPRDEVRVEQDGRAVGGIRGIQPEPVAEPEGEGLTAERYWCGCVREARWERCASHGDLDHDEEPPTQHATALLAERDAEIERLRERAEQAEAEAFRAWKGTDDADWRHLKLKDAFDESLEVRTELERALREARARITELEEDIERLRDDRNEALDKALRFDLDQAGISRRELDAVELVEARARITELEEDIEQLRERADPVVYENLVTARRDLRYARREINRLRDLERQYRPELDALRARIAELEAREVTEDMVESAVNGASDCLIAMPRAIWSAVAGRINAALRSNTKEATDDR